MRRNSTIFRFPPVFKITLEGYINTTKSQKWPKRQRPVVERWKLTRENISLYAYYSLGCFQFGVTPLGFILFTNLWSYCIDSKLVSYLWNRSLLSNSLYLANCSSFRVFTSHSTRTPSFVGGSFDLGNSCPLHAHARVQKSNIHAETRSHSKHICR